MDSPKLHVVMVPWLALGHHLPFLQLSKRIALKGHHVSFFSTPNNIKRLPKLPHHLTNLIHFVEIALPSVEHLPEFAEATVDLPSDDLRPYLRKAYDTFSHHLTDFLLHSSSSSSSSSLSPHWIIFDYAAHWVPDIAAKFGIPCAFLGLHNAAALAFFGPPSVLCGEESRTEPEQFTVVPKWFPFPSTIAYRLYEARELFRPGIVPDASGVSEAYRYSKSIGSCSFVAVRSCMEFEANWIRLLAEIYDKPVIPVGILPPSVNQEGEDETQSSKNMFEWLDKQTPASVVYVAFGSEAKLNLEQVNEIALGLQLSELPFVWALRAPESWLPEKFRRRTETRGIVLSDWVPQAKILAHPNVGAFLTHGGWGSISEGLGFGLAMVLLPLMFDQGLNARNLVERGVGVEVPRDEEDGSFTGSGIADTLRLVMMEDGGERFRARARECKEIFGDEMLHDGYVEHFLKYLWDNRKQETSLLQNPCM